MDDLNTLLNKYPVKVKIFDIQGTTHLTGTVVLYPWTACTVTAVGDIELVAVSPRISLLNFYPFVGHVAAQQVIFDHFGNRTILYKGGQNLYRKSKIGGDTCNVGFRAGNLHLKK